MIKLLGDLTVEGNVSLTAIHRFNTDNENDQNFQGVFSFRGCFGFSAEAKVFIIISKIIINENKVYSFLYFITSVTY